MAVRACGGVLGLAGVENGLATISVSTPLYLLAWWFVLTRRYEVWADRIRVVYGWPFAQNIHFATVSDVRPAHTQDALMRFAPSHKTSVEVRLSDYSLFNRIISPRNREEFIEKATQALG